MPRPRVTRNAEIERNFKQRQRDRKIITQRQRRQKQRQYKEEALSNAQCVKRWRKSKAEQQIVENKNNLHYLGLMNIQCSYCQAKHFEGEIVSHGRSSFNDCCSHGAVPVASFDKFPVELRCLFEGTHNYSREFWNDIRSYNASLSFASFNANLVNFSGRRPGPYCFKIWGDIYYQINTAIKPEPDEIASFGQLFFMDPSEANRHKLDYNPDLSRAILQILDGIIRKYNRFAKSYHMMKEEIHKLEKKSKKNGEPIPEVKMVFIPKGGIEAGHYNPQRSNEVAAIFTTTADGDIPKTYVTLRNQSTNKLEYVSSMNPRVEPWVYPLFYPYGTDGWHRDLHRLRSSKRISRSAYIKN